MIQNLYLLLQKIINYNLYHFLVLLITLFLLLIFYNLIKIKLTFVDYKIYNFALNSFFIFLYISIFFFGILTLRYFRIGNSFNVIEHLNKIKEFFNECSYLGVLNIIILIVILFIILNIIKKFLHYQIKKRHLYYYYKSFQDTYKYFVEKQRREPYEYWDFDFYVSLIDNLSQLGSYSYFNIHYLIVSKVIYKPCIYVYKNILKIPVKNSKSIYFLATYFEIFIRILPYFLLIFFLFYDCIYNNYNLYLIFYYLPFLFLYQIWKSVCLFLQNANKSLDLIIHRFYYLNDKVYYLDLLDIEYDFILTYMKNNFVCYTNIYKKKKDFKNLEKIEDFDDRYFNYILECSQGIQKQIYILSEKEKNKIINPYTGDKIDIQDVETIENWPLIKRKKKNNENKVESLPFLDFESFIKEKK